VIEVRGLTKRYGSTVAVDRLSFEVPPGAVTGFLDLNGSGKSTTMRIHQAVRREEEHRPRRGWQAPGTQAPGPAPRLRQPCQEGPQGARHTQPMVARPALPAHPRPGPRPGASVSPRQGRRRPHVAAPRLRRDVLDVQLGGRAQPMHPRIARLTETSRDPRSQPIWHTCWKQDRHSPAQLRPDTQ
jgi:energy-coupling factor transporter ATP-binding protein EcfA2